jgi:predicted dehydrogenase
MSDSAKPSRRTFLKGTTAAAAGIALAGGLDIARTAYAAGSDELKIALVGCGGRGTGAVVDCLTSCENIRLFAMGDVFKEHAEGSLARLRKTKEVLEREAVAKIDVPPERMFIGFDAFQKVIDAGPDIVFLTTPPGFRPAQYAAAVAAGKHVFMEKPICVDAPGFRSVMETNKAADEKGLKVVVGLQRRHSKQFIGPVKAIQDGSLGPIAFMRCYWNGGSTGFARRFPDETEMEHQIRNWNVMRWLCGDHIVEQHCHEIDICNWIKADHPVKAVGMGACVQRFRGRTSQQGLGDIYDQHFIEYTYKDGTKMFSQCRQQPNQWEEVCQITHGAKGVKRLGGWGMDAYKQEHVDLVNAIRQGGKLNDGWHGATSSFTAVLGRMATYSGIEVDWDEAVAKGPSELPGRLAYDADPPALPDKDGNYAIPLPGLYKPY